MPILGVPVGPTATFGFRAPVDLNPYEPIVVVVTDTNGDSREFTYIPDSVLALARLRAGEAAHFRRIEHVQFTYSCPSCPEHIQTAAKPPVDPVPQVLVEVEKEYNAGKANYGAGHLEAAKANFDRAVNAVRRISSGLRPEVLDEIGLHAAIEWQAREFQRRTGIRCVVEISPGFTNPDKERSTALFRIFQELLTNVARHANATRVSVTLADAESLALKVEDNGRGIQESEFESPRSLGFLGLRERVLAFGGTIDVKGHEGTGTTVSVCIPLTVQQPVFHA